MADNPDRVYWDTCTYINHLRGGHETAEAMRAILKAWEDGAVNLVTSALTVVELVYFKCDGSLERIGEPERDAIFDLFSEYRKSDGELVLVELNRKVAEGARALTWEHGIHPRDAVHVASALEANCPVLHTHDIGLHSHSEQVGSEPPLKIMFPEWNTQPELL